MYQKINMSIHKSSTIHEVIIEIEYRMNGRDSAKRKKQNRKRKKKKKKKVKYSKGLNPNPADMYINQ